MTRKLKFAVLGLGRMGQRHAWNVAFAAPRAELVAVCDPRDSSLDWAKSNLPEGVVGFKDATKCITESGADAILIASETSTHAPLALEAIAAGKHVLLEKPISLDLETSQEVVAAAQQHPELKVMVGLSRRFDESYRETKRMIDQGALGKPHMVKSATCDQHDPSGFFVNFSKASGGLIVDCGIHDIDIARWLLSASQGCPNPKKQVNRVFAIGQNVRHPELAQFEDSDNAMCMVEFANGGVLSFHLSRTAMHGHDCFAEIFGTEGKAVINGNPQLNRVEIRDTHGVRTQSTPTYYERFREAFVNEINEFTAAVLDDKPLPVQVEDALEAMKIAQALTYSFRRGVPVTFDDNGNALLPGGL